MLTKEEFETYERLKWSFGRASDPSRRLLALLYAIDPSDSAAYKRMVRIYISTTGKTKELRQSIKEDEVLITKGLKSALLAYLEKD